MRFEEIQLSKLTEKIGSGSTPRGGQATYLKKGEIRLVRSQNIYNHFFESNGLAFISQEQADKLRNVEVLEKDILINITGDSVVRNMIITKEHLPARVNQHVSIIRCKANKLDPYYLSALLTSNRYQNFLLSMSESGGTRKALTKKMLEDLVISLPKIENQRKIGNVLKLFNGKIKINNKKISLLEELAQTLFKQWFVDFEFPNEDGEPYKSSGGKMIESELGMIPEGWEVCEFGDVIYFQNGHGFKSKDLNP